MILDPPDVIKRKISRAVTDTEGVVRYSDNQPGIKNLINILGALTGKAPEDIENEYQGKGYAEFKSDVTDAIVSEFEPIQKKVADYLANKDYIESIFKKAMKKRFMYQQRHLERCKEK